MIHELPPDPETCRLLRRLAAPGAWLAQPAEFPEPGEDDGASCYQLMTAVAGRGDMAVARHLVARATQKGWLMAGEGRVTLTPAGAASLRRALSGGGAPSADRAAGMPSSSAAREARRQPTAQNPGVNEAESPLGWLRRRKDKNGQALIGDEQFAAGERLRADVFFAGLSARITMDWGRSGGSAPSRRSAPGGSAQMLDNMVAARQRVERAMRAVGPELSGILMDVCGFMKGLESIEIEHGWPPRSGKVVLLHALSMLARHYGMTKPEGVSRADSDAGAMRTRHWGASGYRPDISGWADDRARPNPSRTTKSRSKRQITH